MASENFLVAEIDRAGLIQAANPALCRLRGVEMDELLGSGLPYLVNAEDRDSVAALVRAGFSGTGGEVVARLLTANGDPMPTVRWGFLPLRDGSGAVASCLCLGADLQGSLGSLPPGPEVKQAREELETLREEAERLKQENLRLGRELKRAKSQVSAGPPPPVPADLFVEDEGLITLREVERRHIFHTLQECGGRVSGPKGAAAVLGLHPNTLRSRMEKLGISKSG